MRITVLVLFLAGGTAFAQQARIDALTPSQGPIAGGTLVTVQGVNFTGASVKIDGKIVDPLSRSDTAVALKMPAHDNGYAVIEVGTAVSEFIYLAPRLDEIPPGYITTVAGVGQHIRFGQPATRSMLQPLGIALAPNGDIYFGGGLVMRVRADGILQRIAGSLDSAMNGKLGDGGPALDAFIAGPRSVALDPAGNVYVGDIRARIRKIDMSTGIITTIAGNGTVGFSGDGGPATEALLTQPTHLTSTADGTIYFLDQNVRVRKIAPNGIISTVAGNGTVGESGDGGPATQAQLNSPMDDNGDLVLDGDGNLFILEMEGQRVRKVDAKSGIITTFVSRNGLGHSFRKARGIAVDASNNIYVADQESITKFDRSGGMIDSWGVGNGFSEDGSVARQSFIGSPLALAVAPNGDIIWSDEQPNRLRKINLSTGKLETIAGMGPNAIGVPGPAAGAVFTSPWGDLAFNPSGDLLFSDAAANRIYRISAGIVTVFAGIGMSGGLMEGEALKTDVGDPQGIEIGRDGSVYFVEKKSVRRIDSNGIVHAYAGSPIPPNGCGFSGDGGPAVSATLCQPNDFTFDRQGNMYIADTNNNRIRRVDAQSGVITTVAGSGPSNGYEHYGVGSICGDGGPATTACLNDPFTVALRDDGTIYFNDDMNRRFRKVSPDGIITSMQNWPQAKKLIVGPGQSLFAHGGDRIYRFDRESARLIAGGMRGFAGDGGPATEARLAGGEAENAWGIAVDAEGNLFIHDAGNRRIRAVRFGAVLAPPKATITATASGSTIQVKVFDENGQPAPGVRVDFAAPAAGASCTFSSPFAITDVSGAASVSCYATCIAGPYSVTARPLTASSSATVSFTNPGRPCRRRVVHSAR